MHSIGGQSLGLKIDAGSGDIAPDWTPCPTGPKADEHLS